MWIVFSMRKILAFFSQIKITDGMPLKARHYMHILFLYNLIITYDDVKVLYSSNLLVEDMTSRKNIDVPYDLSLVTDDIEVLRQIDDS